MIINEKWVIRYPILFRVQSAKDVLVITILTLSVEMAVRFIEYVFSRVPQSLLTNIDLRRLCEEKQKNQFSISRSFQQIRSENDDTHIENTSKAKTTKVKFINETRRPATTGKFCAFPFVYRRLLKRWKRFFLEKTRFIHHIFWSFQRLKFSYFLPQKPHT